MPRIALDRVVLEARQSPVRLHALGHAPLDGSPRLALGKVRTEPEPAAAHEPVIHGDAHEAVRRIPVLVETVGNVAHHARPVVDLAMSNTGAPAVAMRVDHEVFAAPLLAEALRLVACVADRPSNGPMIALQNAAHADLSLTVYA